MTAPAYSRLESRFARYYHLNRINELLGWDKETLMPEGAGEARAADMATLSLMQHEILTAPDLPALIADAKAAADHLNDWQRANLSEMERRIQLASAVPADLEHAFSEVSAACSMQWVEAKQKSDYKLVLPLFKKMLPLLRERTAAFASVLGCSLYDAALDQFEPSLRRSQVDPLFSELAQKLPTLAERILEKQATQPVPLALPAVSSALQEKLVRRVLSAMGFDMKHGRLDLSEHPFSSGQGHDSRLTGRYLEDEPLWSLAAFMHEAGHGLYEQGTPAAWRLQPVGQSRGMAVHESQSLYWEKQVGQSRAFLEWLAPHLQTDFNSHDTAFAADNLFKHINHVAKTYIRFEADEVTYPLHIIMRYQLEQALLSGDLPPEDLQGAWAEKLQSLLGLKAPEDKRGCAQDPHWFCGSIGYFPDYSLGALIAAIWAQAQRRDLGNIDTLMQKGDLSPLLQWHKQHIHQRGSYTTTSQLIADAAGEKLSATPFLNYLEGKYL